MSIDLSGNWKLWLEEEETLAVVGEEERYPTLPKSRPVGEVQLPGTLQSQGFGRDITLETPWVSGLHDPFWYEREEYSYPLGKDMADRVKGCPVPFLTQTGKHYIGMAWYERTITVEAGLGRLRLYMEAARWRSHLWIDGKYIGSDCSLCGAHEIDCGELSPGPHIMTLGMDNRMQYPYRPDSHTVSDALGASWNGVLGTFCLMTEADRETLIRQRQNYAGLHPRQILVKEGQFIVDGRPEYFRGTHFGGDFPFTGYPVMERAWWDRLMGIVKEWGLNFIRCHSYCPPESAFAAADEAGIYIQAECGMWNIFNEEIPMLWVLENETERILRQFGHHPSFVLFSPTNEPGGSWYEPLKRWVEKTRAYDEKLGYGGRRVYTAQSGWFYDVPPGDVTGTDYLYFHRSGYGPFLGGNIRNSEGWKGSDYRSSLEGTRLPVICHEMGQWCSYPDYSLLDKDFGFSVPGNYLIFRENAKAHGILELSAQLSYCSGRTQVMMYKEDMEANFRTPHIYGFEMLDLHDYTGQGTAPVGVLDLFWERKGYVKPEEFRQFCSETVLLARIRSYIYRNTDIVSIPVEICHFGRRKIAGGRLLYQLLDGEECLTEGWISCPLIVLGKNQELGSILLDFTIIKKNSRLTLLLKLGEVQNHWDLYVYVKSDIGNCVCKESGKDCVLYTRNWRVAREGLRQGRAVVYSPWLCDLDFECPSVSEKPVFWNAQMGPVWERSLGLVIQEEHPVFRDFPVESYAGWQWERILRAGRGFHIEGLGVEPIVWVIDDWNRNLMLALIWEAKVEAGRLLVVSACLEGDFDSCPEASSLLNAILNYASSPQFQPEAAVEAGLIEERLFPVLRTGLLVQKLRYDQDAVISDKEALLDPNPNRSVKIERTEFPITIIMDLQSKLLLQGILYVPDQRDRLHMGCIREYRIETGINGSFTLAAQGKFVSSFFSQKVYFREKLRADSLRITVLSCYGDKERTVWEAREDGWYPAVGRPGAMVQAAGFHLICEEEWPQSDERFWDKNRFSSTKEIDN